MGGIIMRKNKSKKSEDRAERRKIEHEIMLNKQMDQTNPYPEKLNVEKDYLRSDLFCLRNDGFAYMTVKRQADETTVSYVREDMVTGLLDAKESQAAISRLEKDLLIWKDRVESLLAARQAVKITTLTILKRLALRFLICYLLFGVICWLIPATYSFMINHVYLLVLLIVSIGLITAYITSYVYSPILKLERELDEKKDYRI